MTMIFNKYIDAYIRKVEDGAVVVGKDILNLINNVVKPKLSQPNVIIKHDMIEQAITKINEYFPFKLLDWQEFIIGLTHCYYDDDTLVWDTYLTMMGVELGKMVLFPDCHSTSLHLFMASKNITLISSLIQKNRLKHHLWMYTMLLMKITN